ncbi:hypothetical protein B7495_06040 [Cryobacterium sp. LW097]|nr:hypothetical protein B7495_06040 [Cryobacterium sp. LW097]
MVFRTRDSAPENPLQGRDFIWGIEGGCWLITTEDSTYRIDLDALTVDRCRFSDSPDFALGNGPTRPLKEIVECRVGRRGYWLLSPEGRDIETIEHFWQRSSRVVSIQAVPTPRGSH